MTDATAAREEVLDLFEETRQDYLAEARAMAQILAFHKGIITINDVREACPVPEGIDPRVLGAVLRGPAWEPVGFVQSTRRTCHGRPIRQFKYKG